MALVEFTEKLVPISDFSQGKASKIFSDVSEAKKELQKLDGSLKKQVLAGIRKVSKNPLPTFNGYGKPLGNKNKNTGITYFKSFSTNCKRKKASHHLGIGFLCDRSLTKKSKM